MVEMPEEMPQDYLSYSSFANPGPGVMKRPV
jgi:hypothetical protein